MKQPLLRKAAPGLAALLLASLACQTVMAPFSGQPAEATAAPSQTAPAATPPPLAACTPGRGAPPIYDSLPANPPHASIGDPYAPELGNLGYDVQHYTLALTLDPRPQGWLCGRATLTALVTAATLDEFALDFIGFAIQSLTVDGVLAEYYRTADKVVIGLDEPLTMGDEFLVQIDYQGEVVRRPSPYVPFTPSLGMFFPDPEMIFVVSEPDGARYWFPANDHPRDKAAFRFELLAPEGFTAVANGLLQSETPGPEGTTFTWQHDYPMAPYLATVAVGKLELIESGYSNGVVLRSYSLPASRAELEAALQRTQAAIPWLEALLGPYPFEAYGYVTVRSGGITLETQTLVALSTFMIEDEVLIHELAHMWFGNSVSLHSWGEMWRNEGFATYFQILWNYRDDPAGFAAEMESLTRGLDSTPGLEPLNDLSPANLFGRESYFKGAALVYALQQEVGDEAFFEGLRLYLACFGGATASDADFIALMEEVSGQDLGEFFRVWLEE